MLIEPTNAPDPRAFRGVGLAFPLAVTPQGALATASDNAKVEQSIWLILSTAKQERVMRPDYGCDLHQLVFSPNDETTAGLAIHYVRRALDLFEPRAEVVRVDAAANPDDPGRLDVTLDYRVRATQQDGQLTVSISLQGEPT